MTLNIPAWLGPEHVALAAVRACGDYMAAYAAAGWTSDPFFTTPLPSTPSGYSPKGVPNDGGYYMREMQAPDSPRPVPFVEFWVDGQPTISEYTDSEASIYLVRLGIRARVSSAALTVTTSPNTTTSTAAQVAALHARAMSMCRLAQIVTSNFLRESALYLEPTSAFGICWNDISAPPSLDIASSVPADGSGSITADAVAFIDVYQRLYVPAGIAQASPPPPVP
jgi:hypothetical protein